MASTDRLRHLATVQGSFHGRLLAARLGTEGIVVELRGMSEGPYPLQGAVEVFVSEAQLDLAREVLLADAVDAAVDADSVEFEYSSGPPQGGEEADRGAESDESGLRRIHRLGTIVTVALVITLVIVGLVSLTR